VIPQYFVFILVSIDMIQLDKIGIHLIISKILFVRS